MSLKITQMYLFFWLAGPSSPSLTQKFTALGIEEIQMTKIFDKRLINADQGGAILSPVNQHPAPSQASQDGK